MNTPKKLKRYNRPSVITERPGGQYTSTIGDLQIAAEVGQLAAEFVQLENVMAHLLGALLGVQDVYLMGYILRAIKSPKGRIDVMKNLLEKAPNNKDLPAAFDEAISEFHALNKARNNYIHGDWYTHESGAVFVSFFDEHGLGFLSANKVEAGEIAAIRARIGAHLGKVLRLAWDHGRQMQQQEQSPQAQ